MFVSISFFHYKSNKFWAFKQMIEAKKYLENNTDISFFKMLGTGIEGGFVLPDFSVYSLLCVWKDKESGLNFLNDSDHANEIKKKAKKRIDYLMVPILSNGLWDKVNPFNYKKTENIDPNNKIGVITRGKIKLTKQLDFWLNVPAASKAIKFTKGVEFYKGIGELPFLSQATFSVWKDSKSIHDFAYKNNAHAEVINKTRKRGWYSEDLFARFEILNTQKKYFS